jgi:hypothetical protein
VTLRSSAPLISIEPDYAFTNANGYALFTLRASSTVSGSLTAVAEGIPLNQHPEISFIPNASEHISVGARIKLPDDHQVATQADSTIYYIGSDGRRHPFLNENIYLNWYPDFRGILTVSAQELANIELGLPVSYRPGSRLVKFISDPKVYAISKPRDLRWLKSEAIAAELYGSSWSSVTDDLSEAFRPLFQFASDVAVSAEYSPSQEKAKVQTIDALF